jgi:type VI protein secretion system component Hcp
MRHAHTLRSSRRSLLVLSVVAALVAALTTRMEPARGATPKFSIAVTVQAQGHTYSGAASGVSLSVGGGKQALVLTLPLGSKLAPVLVDAARLGTPPAGIGVTVSSAGTALTFFRMTTPQIASVQQDSVQRDTQVKLTMTAAELALFVRSRWHPQVAHPAGRLVVQQSAGSTARETAAITGTVTAARHSTLKVSKPYESAISPLLFDAALAQHTLSDSRLALYVPTTTTVAETYRLHPVTVKSFTESVTGAKYTESATLTSQTIGVHTSSYSHTAANPAAKLVLNMSPQQTIKLGNADVTLIGKHSLTTTEPFNTQSSPALLAAASAGTVISGATLTLYTTPGSTHVAATYHLLSVVVSSLAESGASGKLTETAKFAFGGLTWTLGSWAQAAVTQPAGAVEVAGSSSASATVARSDLQLSRKIAPQARRGSLTFSEPMAVSLDGLLLDTQPNNLSTLQLQVYESGSRNVAATWVLSDVTIASLSESTSAAGVQDKITVHAPAWSLTPATDGWHSATGYRAGSVTVKPPSGGTGATLKLPVQAATASADSRSQTPQLSIKLVTPYAANKTSTLIAPLLSAAIPQNTVRLYQPGTTLLANFYRPTELSSLKLDEVADGKAVVDNTTWAYGKVTMQPGTWSGATTAPAGVLTVNDAATASQLGQLPVQRGAATVGGGTAKLHAVESFDPVMAQLLLTAAFGSNASVPLSGVYVPRVDHLSLYRPGSTTELVRYTAGRPSATFTETADSSGLRDTADMASTTWGVHWG